MIPYSWYFFTIFYRKNIIGIQIEFANNAKVEELVPAVDWNTLIGMWRPIHYFSSNPFFLISLKIVLPGSRCLYFLADKSISREMRNTLMDFGGNPGDQSPRKSEQRNEGNQRRARVSGQLRLGPIKLGSIYWRMGWGTSQSDGIPLITYHRSFHSVFLPSLCFLIG